MVQLKIVPLADRVGGNRRVADNSYPSITTARMPPVWSVASLTEARKRIVRSAQAPVAAPIREPAVKPAVVAPPVKPAVVPPAVVAPPTPRGVKLTPGLGILIAALGFLALVPNLVLVAMFWFGASDQPSQKATAHAAAMTQVPAIETSLPAVLTAPATIEAAASEEIGFPIALDGTDAVPPRSIIAIAGLPQGSAFSDGRPYGEAEWNLKPDQIGDLRLTLPATANGDSTLTIKLIAPDGAVIADAETILKVAAPAQEEAELPADSELTTSALPDNADNAAAPAAIETAIAPSRETAIAPPEEAAATPSADAAPEQSAEPTSTPSAKPEKPPSSEPEHTGSIPTEPSGDIVQPSDHVNLRDGPSSSSRILGVVAKGAKVEVLDRKRGWLQVTNPATSEQGWIYGGYIEGASKDSLAKRASRLAEPEQKSDDSFWSRVGDWF
jgi:hypothetical protein